MKLEELVDEENLSLVEVEVIEVTEEPLGPDGDIGGLPSAGTEAALVVGMGGETGAAEAASDSAADEDGAANSAAVRIDAVLSVMESLVEAAFSISLHDLISLLDDDRDRIVALTFLSPVLPVMPVLPVLPVLPMLP